MYNDICSIGRLDNYLLIEADTERFLHVIVLSYALVEVRP